MLEDGRKESSGDDRLASLRIEREEDSSDGGRAWLWLALAAVGAIAVALWFLLSGPPAVSVGTARAREARIEGGGATVLNASGYVTARRQATVSAKVTARVVEVLIEEGMAVAQGQVMARLDDSNIRVAHDLAMAQVRAAEATLEETRVREREAALERSRVERLLEVAIASQADLDAAAAGHDALVARLAQQEREAVVARRQVDVWAQQLEDSEIRAPFAGVVVSKNAQPGEMISPAAAGGGFTRTGIGTVVDMESLEIEVDVNESYINRVRPDQRVVATLDAYTDWEIPASVIAIVPTADRQRATVKVRIGFDALDPRILPDMGVKVAFRESAEESAQPRARVVVPAACGASPRGPGGRLRRRRRGRREAGRHHGRRARGRNRDSLRGFRRRERHHRRAAGAGWR